MVLTAAAVVVASMGLLVVAQEFQTRLLLQALKQIRRKTPSRRPAQDRRPPRRPRTGAAATATCNGGMACGSNRPTPLAVDGDQSVLVAAHLRAPRPRWSVRARPARRAVRTCCASQLASRVHARTDASCARDRDRDAPRIDADFRGWRALAHVGARGGGVLVACWSTAFVASARHLPTPLSHHDVVRI